MKKLLVVLSCPLLLAACASTSTMQATGPSANAVMRPASGSQVHGSVTLAETGNAVRVSTELAGLPSGLITLRIHEKGDCSKPDASSTGTFEREIGPLQVDEFGKAVDAYIITGTTVSKASGGLLGKGVVVQAGKERIACGSIDLS